MLDVMYTLPSEENVKEFTITKKMVDNLFSSKIVKLPSGSKRVIKESAWNLDFNCCSLNLNCST